MCMYVLNISKISLEVIRIQFAQAPLLQAFITRHIVFSAIKFYRRAIKLVPDIEFKINYNRTDKEKGENR